MYRTGKFLILNILVIIFTGMSSATCHDLFFKANQLYGREQYDSAIVLYDSILRTGHLPGAVYFNLGNGWFKKNNLPNAILNYERAKKMLPADGDIDFNLRLANSRTIDKIEGIPPLFYEKLFYSISNLLEPGEWTLLSIVCLWTAFAFMLVYTLASFLPIRKLAFWLSMILFLGAVISFIHARSQHLKWTSRNEAIIFSASVPVKSSPDENGTDLFILHEGTKVTILDELGHWNKIQLANGSVGWLKKNSFEII